MVHWRGFGHDFKTHLLEVLLNPWPCAALIFFYIFSKTQNLDKA